MADKIGVAISTRSRPKVLAKSLSQWALFMPDVLVVNHDQAGAGVAATKNLGITALIDAGCTDLVLADDDCWPIAPWAHLYTGASMPHLMFCWGKNRFEGRLNRDGTDYTLWSWPRGCLLYVRREVIDRVGGMRLEFGAAGGEHVEWSRRIHNAGFTAHPFMDLTTRGVWHYDASAPSTLGRARYDDPKIAAQRHNLLAKHQLSSEFVEFKLR